jgi:hypothetical protein
LRTSDYLDNIYEHAQVYPTQKPERRAKFYTGPVKNIGTGETSFLKAVVEQTSDSVAQDLQTEATWNIQVQPFAQELGVVIPGVESHAHTFKWVLFNHIEGSPIAERELEKYIEKIAKLCASISQVPLGREPNGLGGWMKNRLGRFEQASASEHVSRHLAEQIIRAGESVDDSTIQAGTAHGDINLPNMLVSDQLGDDIGLVDSEFGTLRTKPEWDKPRYHDAAYFYHLLYVQYQRPDLAEKFKVAFEKEMRLSPDFDKETFEVEFGFSVLERTLSMGNHHIFKRDRNKPVSDPRRLEPGPYVQLVEQSIQAISR